jgi:hypothetical protein
MVFKIYSDKIRKNTDENIWDICECGHDDSEHDLAKVGVGYDECNFCECPKYKYQMTTNLKNRMKIRGVRNQTMGINNRRTD